MNLPNKQKGLSSIGWLFIGVTLFFYATILTKIVPVYIDDLSVKDAIEQLKKMQSNSDDPTADVIDALQKQFDIENVRDIDIEKEGVLTVTRNGGTITVVMNYQRTISIFKDNGMLHTMDIVIKFKHKQDIR